VQIIRNALVYDGSGARPERVDVAIDGDRIAAIGDVPTHGDDIDATGLALAPGFIDVHTHDDFAAILHPEMAFKVRGGVTTCIVGNCGMGAAPFPQAALLARSFHPDHALPDWRDHHGYLDLLEHAPAGVNVGMLIGHGTVRMAAMGRDRGVPTDDQMAAMKSIVQEGLDAGALGLSTGLVYEPGRHARTEEIIELAAMLRGTGALYATHMRDEGIGLLASIDEAITIGERAGVPVQISHHKAAGRDAWGLVAESLHHIEVAQARGVAVHADQYPYTAGSTILSAVLNPDVRLTRGLDLADVAIASAAGHPEWEGKSIPEIARLIGTDAESAAAHVLAMAPGATAVMHSMNEADVQTVMRHPSTMIGSDGIPTLEGKPHPRLFGTFARVLGHYARELGLFPLEEAVHRMTGFPAQKFGLEDRGTVRAGAYADLVLFDPVTIVDRGTYTDPKQYPAGVRYVFVNGAPAVFDGHATGVRAGRVLRRATSR